ncbi:DUF2750 domain-containing protein [Neisseria sp. 23W00296]|uniref:DUF2750 domain-containing protein n=1 Tax=unclassified Neisseria TaxID=2623750 RepID=UPI0037583C7F
MAFIHPNKPANLLAMDARTRYEYFVRKVVDFGAVWLLEDGAGGVRVVGSDGRAVCLYPEEAVAEALGGAGFSVRQMTLCAFLVWLDALAGQGMRCAVFPNGDGDAVSCALRQ